MTITVSAKFGARRRCAATWGGRGVAVSSMLRKPGGNRRSARYWRAGPSVYLRAVLPGVLPREHRVAEERGDPGRSGKVRGDCSRSAHRRRSEGATEAVRVRLRALQGHPADLQERLDFTPSVADGGRDHGRTGRAGPPPVAEVTSGGDSPAGSGTGRRSSSWAGRVRPLRYDPSGEVESGHRFRT